MHWIRWLTVSILMAALVAAGVWYWKRPREKPPEYRTAPVTRGDLTQVVTATGQLNPVVNVQVGSQISGRIQKLFADFNTRVTNGQLIAQIDPATFKANVMQAEGNLARAQSALELAQINARRNEELFKQKLIAESEFDQSVAALHQAEADVRIRLADLERARVDLERTSIYSPVDGVVISRDVDVGQTVAASLNAPVLFKIANDLAKMQINAMVSEADVGGVEEGQEVRFTVDAFPQRTFYGKVSQIRNSPTTVQNVVSYDTVIAVDNEDLKLKPGMTANVSIVTGQREDVLKVANAALRFRPPEAVLAQITNNVSGSNTLVAAAGGRPGPAGNPGSPDARRGEMRPRGEGGGMGGGGGGGGGPQRRPRGDSMGLRTVYVLPATNAVPRVAQVRIGLSDGSASEVLGGLREGEQVIVGLSQPQGASAQTAPSNPFIGGGFRRPR